MFSFINWNVDPEIFAVGSVSIRWYGLLFASGFLFGQRIMAHIFEVEKVKESLLDSLLLTMVISTVLGARIGHFAFYEPSVFMNDPLQVIMPPFAGLASHGALIGILLALLVYSRTQKMHFFWLTDRMVIVASLGGFFIRLGNLMNSEIVGKVTDVPWAFLFLRNTEFLPVYPRHPAQLYEALSCLVLFGVLYYLWNRFRGQTPQGMLLSIFIIWVFGLRFLFEYLKENQEAFEAGLPFNMGQILSIPAVLLGVGILIYSLSNKNKAIWYN